METRCGAEYRRGIMNTGGWRDEVSSIRVLFLLVPLILLSGCAVLEDFFSSLSAVSLSLKTPEERHTAFAQSYQAYLRHDYRSAYGSFTTLARGYPLLADHSHYFAGISAARLDSPRQAMRQFARLLQDYPRSVHSPAAAVEIGEIELRERQFDAARAHFARAMNETADPELRQRAAIGTAEAEEAAGETDAALRRFREVRSQAAGTPAGLRARDHIERILNAHPEFATTGYDRVEEARLLLAEKEYAKAESLLQEALEDPQALNVPEILRQLAEAQLAGGKLEAAMKSFWNIAERYPRSPQAPAAIFRMAGVLWNRDRNRAALRLFENYLDRYPGAEQAPDALYGIARIEQQLNDNAQAIARFGELARRFPQHKLAAEAAWRIGWIRFLSQQNRAAAAAFASVPGNAPSARYWQARALEAAGDRAAAQRLYQRITTEDAASYYGILSQRRLDGVGDSAFRLGTIAPVEPTRPTTPAATFTEDFHLPRWLELQAAGVPDLARLELTAIEREYGSDPTAQQYLIAAYQTVDGYYAALRLARANPAVRRSAEETRRLEYPLAFWSDVSAAAGPQHVDPLLVVATMRQESLFNPTARSKADARGLLQLLPSTAKQIASTGSDSSDPQDLYEPQTNIKLGTRYLRMLLDRFGGDPLKALAAYNGGETMTERWARLPRAGEADVFVENITYRETRDYVKRVIGNYAKYAQFYAK